MGKLSVKRRRWSWTVAIVATLLVGSWYLPTGWLVISPGSVMLLSEHITVAPNDDGTPTAGISGGDVLLLTVAARHVNVYILALSAAGLLGPSVVVHHQGIIPPGLTESQYLALSSQQMSESIILATALALCEAGESATVTGEGALVVAIQSSAGPPGGGLLPGDVIVAIEGMPVQLAGDLAPFLRERASGQSVTLEVLRDGSRDSVQVTPGSSPAGAEEAMLGAVLLSSAPALEMARDVAVDPSGIGGPSGGLALTLAIYQALGHDDLLQGRLIAASGSVLPDGTVGPVGGVGLKAIAAERAGAQLMLVAQANLSEARAAATALTVAAVDSFEAAVELLRGR